jgi:lysophospholipase L1-like esterase
VQPNQFSRRQFIKQNTGAALAVGLSAFTPLMPAPGNEPHTFLFQGDSITDGARGREGDPNHIMGHGFAFSIASRAGAAFPERTLTFYNRGVSGNTVPDLQARWEKDTLSLQPDVLSILVGINDTDRAIRQKNPQATAQFEASYRQLLQATKAQLPHCLLVLCEPFIAPVGRVKESWADWQTQVQPVQAVVQRLAGEYGAVWVPLQAVFDKAALRAPAAYWVWDGIHPTVAGHELIVQQWLKVVSKTVPFLKAIT